MGRRSRWPGSPKPGIPPHAREKIVARDQDGAKQRSEFWLRGELVGKASWQQGRLAVAAGMRGGVLHGLQIEYAPFGAVRPSYAEPFVRGRQHGWALQYGDSGQVLMECPFRRGTGTDYWCDDAGNLAEEHPLVDGVLSGVERWWSGPESVFAETSWRDGKPHGPRRRWKQGSLETGYPEFFARGRRVSRRAYLSALRTDSTLPALLPEDDRPGRRLPEAFLRLRQRTVQRHSLARRRRAIRH